MEGGKIRAWGVSNFDVDGMEEVERIAGRGRMACNQVLYHLGERYIDHALVDWCAKRKIAVVAYSPFGSGHFPSPRSAGGRLLKEIAEAHGATPHQIALAFLTRHRDVFAIPKAARITHVEQNAAAGALRLTRDEIARIEQAFPMGEADRELPVI